MKDVAGNALATDYAWGFSTVTTSPFSSIWDETTTPATASANDTNAVEVGVKFRSEIAGYITGVRFYKGVNNTGTHIGNLWDSNGQLLSTATFVNESASGWQQVNFGTPVSIVANTTYVASYHTGSGGYALDGGYFLGGGVDNAPLRALANGEDGGNGVYIYSATSAYPSQTYNGGNYWVDVVFATEVIPDTTAPSVSVTSPVEGASLQGVATVTGSATDNVGVTSVQFQLNGVNLGAPDLASPYTVSWDTTVSTNGAYQITAIATDAAGNSTTSPVVNVTVANPVDTTAPTVLSVTPADAAADVAVDGAVTAVFSEAMDPASIDGTTVELRDGNNNLVPASVNYDGPSRTATVTPSGPLANGTQYTALVRGGATDPVVKDAAGNALAADYTWSFITVAGAGANCPCSIWDETTTPATASANDTGAVEVGVKFRSEIAGYITGVRFYKGVNNTGTHIGNLWDSNGQLLSTATFVNESVSGWQQVDFGTPVSVAANTTYVASYHTGSGGYAVDGGYFLGGGVDNAPLRALANGEDGGNGVYIYSATSAYPSQTYNGGNYWIDVVFATSVAADTTAPTVLSVTPADGATDVASDGVVTAVFSEAMDPASISGSTIELRDGGNNLVSATVSYDDRARRRRSRHRHR